MNASQPPSSPGSAPASILIVGCGVFGISTVLSLLRSSRYDQTAITIVDAYTSDPDAGSTATGQLAEQREFTASLDTSRIIRPDYTNALYAGLADRATALFRQGWAEDPDATERTYTQPGLVLVSSGPEGSRGKGYVRGAYENTLKLAREAASGSHPSDAVQNLGLEPVLLPKASDVEHVLGAAAGSLSGSLTGYINPQAGWANASAGIAAAKRKVLALGGAREAQGKAPFRSLTGRKVSSLVLSDDKKTIVGARMDTGEQLYAATTILATGAWTASLLPSLISPRLRASGQVLAYMPLNTIEEISKYAGKPTVLDMETGMFIIFPPAHYKTENRDKGHIKIARHGWGYSNTSKVLDPITSREEVCYLPVEDHKQFFTVPTEGMATCRQFADLLLPEMKDRDFNFSRVCWYTDTPTSDFLIDFVPDLEGLIVASGGSGHGYKFLPVIGDKVVARLEGRLDTGLADLWRWRLEHECEQLWKGDGDCSRGGRRGMKWDEEIHRHA